MKFYESLAVVAGLWDFFDDLVFKIILGLFDALASIWPVTQKMDGRGANSLKFGSHEAPKYAYGVFLSF